jgi:hypothetical protein
VGVIKENVKSFLLRYGIAFGIGCIFTAVLTYFIVIGPLHNVHAKDIERANKLQLDVEQYRKSATELAGLLADARKQAEGATAGIDSAIGSIGDGQRGVAESQARVGRLQTGIDGDIGLAQEIARQAKEALAGLRGIQSRLDSEPK